MRSSRVPRQPLAAVMCAILAGGCSSYFDNISAPTPVQVSSYASELGKITVTDDKGARQMYSSEYLLASISYSNQKCDDFFDKLSRYQQDSNFVDKVLSAGIAASTPLLASYQIGAKTIATVAASVAYAENLNKFSAEIYAYSAYASQLHRHVKDQMGDFLKDVEKDWKDGKMQPTACGAVGGCYNELERMVVVRGRAQAYANICSIANLRAIIESSLANTKSECQSVGTGAPAGAAALAGGVANCEAKPKS